ncbi:hypothetical protein OJJOAM_002508 [Cupriavidus sp. H18C1]
MSAHQPEQRPGQDGSPEATLGATAEPTIAWTEEGVTHRARWRSEAGMPPPRRVVIADDRTDADTAYRLACEGTALLWRGDFQNARQLLQAMARRVERKPRRAQRQAKAKPAPATPAEAFHLHRQAQAQRARTLGMLLLPFEADHTVPLRRAPDVRDACTEAYGPGDQPYVASMRELLGLIGAHEWRKKGVPVPALGDRIHPWYGVFSPVRGEYVDLVGQAPLPKALARESLAFDIGTGTGVLAAMLARRGIARVVATDQDPRAPRLRRRQHRPARADQTGGDRAGGPLSDRPRPAGGLQSAVGAGARQRADRARHLRSRQPDAARLPRGPGRASDR